MPVQNAKQIVAQVGETNFAIAMLQLCEISYYYLDIPDYVSTVTPLTQGGSWSCEWGPEWDFPFDTNLAFVACYTEQNAPSPMFTCVVIRGTDIDILDPVGIAWQLWEDADPENTVPLSWPNDCPDALIANGTNDGLQTVQSLSPWGGPLLRDWLGAMSTDPGLGQLVVTGHSLGGCLTTVVAPWLQTALPGYNQAILPVTFAAPTAGNPPFANYFNSLFQYTLLYQNPLDIAPLVYGNLPAVQYIYDLPWNVLMPPDLADVLSKMECWLKGIPYQQPTSNAPFLGTQFYRTKSWVDEAFHQHHPTTYMSLLEGTNIGLLPRVRSRRGVRPRWPLARAG